MRNNFLLAIAMLLLFVTSCKKDTALTPQEFPSENSNPPQDNSTTINSLDGNPKLELTVENFFNATYVRDYLDLKIDRVLVSDQIFDVMEGINESEYNKEVVSQVGFFYGMPCWSCAEIDPNFNEYSIVPIVSLPDAVITGIILTNHESNPIEIELVDRKNLEKNYDPNNLRHEYLQMVFSFFDNLISKTNSEGQVDSRENICLFNPDGGMGAFCACSETGEVCIGGTLPAGDQGDCGTCPGQTSNNGGGSNGGGFIIIDLGNYPNWNFGDFGSNGGDSTGGGGSGGSVNIPNPTWGDLDFTWDDIDPSTFEAVDPNDTSFPPVESSGNNNTNTLDNVSQYNLSQLEQLYKIRILNFINTYQLPYLEQDLTDMGLFTSCALASSAADFFECGKYHLISSIFSNLNLTGSENYYIFDHFDPLFNQVVNIVAEEGDDYASDAVKAFISLNSIPNTNMDWLEFLDLYKKVVIDLKPLLNLNENEVDLLLHEKSGLFVTELLDAIDDNPDVDDLIPDCDGCSASEAQIVRSAHNNGVEDLDCIIQQLSEYDGNTPSIVKDAMEQEFGGVSNTFFASALSIMLKFSKFHVSGADYEIDNNCGSSSTTAWVYPLGNLFDVKICKPKFFNVPSLTQEYSLVHEWTHLYMLNADHAYSWQPNYSNLGFFLASMNADSYEEFIKTVCQ